MADRYLQIQPVIADPASDSCEVYFCPVFKLYIIYLCLYF